MDYQARKSGTPWFACEEHTPKDRYGIKYDLIRTFGDARAALNGSKMESRFRKLVRILANGKGYQVEGINNTIKKRPITSVK